MAQATRSAASSARLSDDPLENVSSWFQINRKPLLMAVGGVAVVSVLLFGYRMMDAGKREDASIALARAQGIMASGQLPQADSALARVVRSYAGTASGQQAALMLAQVRYERNMHDAGIKGLEESLGSASPEFRSGMLELMAAGYEAKARGDRGRQPLNAVPEAIGLNGERLRALPVRRLAPVVSARNSITGSRTGREALSPPGLQHEDTNAPDPAVPLTQLCS
jgi:hypothetical protein